MNHEDRVETVKEDLRRGDSSYLRAGSLFSNTTRDHDANILKGAQKSNVRLCYQNTYII